MSEDKHTGAILTAMYLFSICFLKSDVPTAPLNLKSRLRRDLGDPFIELTWDYPLHDGGVPVSTYQVEFKPIGAAWSNAASLQTVEKQINIWKTSQEEEVYHVRLSAVNGVGFGETSSILKVAFAGKMTLEEPTYYDFLHILTKPNTSV